MKEERNFSILENQASGVSMGVIDENSEPQKDDRGTESQSARVLKRIRDEVFDASDEKLARGLERSLEEIAEWLNGKGTLDGEALRRVRAFAREWN